MKTVYTADLIEVLGSAREANGAPALVTPSLTTIERGFYYDPSVPSSAVINSNNVTWASNVLGGKINHVLQNGVPQWVSTTTYAIGNVANHTNSLWIALASNTNSAPTDVNANWRKLATVDLIPTLNSLLPSQTGNANKVLITNGTNASWASIPFATVNFDGTTSADLTGTFTRALAIVTVTATGHNHQVGHRIYFVGAGVTSGIYTVATVVNANSFTFDSGVSGTIGSTACTLQRRAIRGSLNVANVSYIGVGDFIVNLINALPDTNYVFLTGVGGTGAGRTCTLTEDIFSNTRFTNNMRVNTGGAAAYGNFEFNHIGIFR